MFYVCSINITAEFRLRAKRNIQQNVTQQEYKALKKLRQNKELVVTIAVKGVGIDVY